MEDHKSDRNLFEPIPGLGAEGSAFELRGFRVQGIGPIQAIAQVLMQKGPRCGTKHYPATRSGDLDTKERSSALKYVIQSIGLVVTSWSCRKPAGEVILLLISSSTVWFWHISDSSIPGLTKNYI